MSFVYFEGKMDYLAATPALILTFRASGSMKPGRPCVFDAGNTGDVYQPTASASGSLIPVGVVLKTVADQEATPVLVWGVAKNLSVLSNVTLVPGHPLVVSGSASDCVWSTSGSGAATVPVRVGGKVLSGSASGASNLYALIDCMR